MDTKSVWIIDSTAPEGIRECWIERIEPVECTGGLQPVEDGVIAQQKYILGYHDGTELKTVERHRFNVVETVNPKLRRMKPDRDFFYSKEEAVKFLLDFMNL